jgi:glycosyltransferase involved in cell wall biosynthesis
MTIAVNTRLLLKGKLEGIGWFSYETLKRITQNNPDVKFLFIFDRKFSDEFIFSDNIHPIILPPPTRHPLLWYAWLEYSIPYILRKHKPDLFFSPDGFMSLSTKTPTLSVIHDINFAHNPQDLPERVANYYNKYFPQFAQKSTRLATVSEYSKQDICKTYNILPEKVDVVYNGINKIYEPLSQEIKTQTKQKYTEGNEYFVFVGALSPRKNVARLLQAFDEFVKTTHSNYKMVIVGDKLFMNNDLNAVYNSMTHKNKVVFTGRLSPEDLKCVLGSAKALTFVPYFEGFGIPIVEAMACNIPVISSNVTSMPEVAGDAALFVNPYSVDEIKEAMIKLSLSESLCKSLIEKSKIQQQKFSWDKTAEKLWISMQKTIDISKMP